MRITIHRGTDQVGGCVTEYESNGWKLFVDYGEQLPGTSTVKKLLKIDGLTCGDVSHSALLITHYHGDHIGKIADLPQTLPIFIGKMSKEILSEFAEYIGPVSDEYRRIKERLETASIFSPGYEFEFGDFKIMPVVIDHSAFDAYAFRIEAGGLKVLHTGDFRTHGFRSKKLPRVIENFVGKVHYIVCEATNVNHPDATALSEHELQRKFEDAFRDSKYNVVYLSSTNIDRLFALYHAAMRTNRPFYVDAYQKKMMDIVAGRDRIWGKSKLYNYIEGREPIVLQQDGNYFRITEKFKHLLADRGYVLIARANDRFDKLTSQLPSAGKRTFLSMWNGYADASKSAYNPVLAHSIGCGYEYLHTSGHCDMQSLENLISLLCPNAIIPIHTENPPAFADQFGDRWPVLLLNDGDTFAPIRDLGYDNIEAKIIACKKPEGFETVDNPENMPWWSIDQKCIGEFHNREDAEFALRHVVYAPSRTLAYAIEENEDMAPWAYVIYTPDFAICSEYNYGGHKQKDGHYQECIGFKNGDLAYAAIYPIYRAIVPCQVIGSITEDFIKTQFEHDQLRSHDSFEDYIREFQDWYWDAVIVRPLVRLSNSIEEMDTEIEVQRIYLFPYDIKDRIKI